MRKKNSRTSASSEFPCLRRALVTAAAMALVLGTSAAAQVLTTTVQGTVYRADGTPASGTVLVSWSAFTTPQNQAVVAGNKSAIIGADGFLSLNLTPNADALPSGSYYTAVYHLSDGTVYPEYWVVPASGTASVAFVRAQLEPSTIAVAAAVTPSYVQGALASLSTTYLPLAGGTLTGMLTLSGDPAAVNQAATKHYVDQSTAQALPLIGGNVQGAVSTQKEIDKQPRIDVTHPDFAAGCAGVNSNPTGQVDLTCANDSSCAVKNAIAYQESLYTASGGLVNPALYFPEGCYKISSELVIPGSVPILGDGVNASFIRQVGPYATGVKIIKTNQPPSGYLSAGQMRDLTIEGNGASTWGTLLEIQDAVGYQIENVRLYNTAGRGLEQLGTSERMKIHNLEIDTVRWPAVFAGDGNEIHWTGIQINAPGKDANGDCFTDQCGAGQKEPAGAPASLAVATASASGGVATFTISGATSAVWSAGQDVQIAGPWGLTGYQAVYRISTINYASGAITMTAPAYWGQSGSGSVADATILTSWQPPSHAAITVEAAQNMLFSEGSIKSLQVMNGFQEYVADGIKVNKIYFEGFPTSNSPPRLSHSIVAGGTQYIMQIGGTTAAGTTTTVPWSQGMWGLNWYDDVADVTSTSTYDPVRIYPPDAAYGSTTMSAYQSGVQQGQYEVAGAVFSPNGSGGVTVTLVHRNLSGSTAPAGTAWVNNSLMVFYEHTGNYGGNLQVTADHLEADAATSEDGYYENCSDTVPGLPCAEAIVGYEPNGITSQAPTSNAGHQGVVFRDTDGLGHNINELTGSGAIKNPSGADILLDNPTGMPYTQGELNPVLSGVNPTAPFDNVLYSVNFGPVGAIWNWFNPNLGWQSSTLSVPGNPYFLYWDAGNGMVSTSGNLSTTGSADFLEELSAQTGFSNFDTGMRSVNGWEYGNKECHYDQPSSSSAHALSRWCLWGGPGYSPEMEYDTWSGSAWVPSLSATSSGVTASNLTVPGSLHAQGAMTAAAINGEIAVDGQTYVTLNDAWKAAVAQATATGQDQTVRLGPGSFPVAATLSEPANGACVNLLGSAGSTVNADSPQVATTLTVPNPLGDDLVSLGNAQQAQGCTFQNLNVLASGNATHAFELQWFRGLLMENVAVNDTSSDGIILGEETPGHQSNFLLRNVSVSYSAAAFTPANRPSYGIHLEKTAIDSALDEITVRNALIAAVYNEGTGNTGYLIHGFGYPYTCTTAPCANNASSGSAANASYATSYVVYDTGGGGSEWTDTYVDSPSVAGFYIGANGVSIDGGHIQWPDLTSFPAANLAYVASSVTNNLLIGDVSCLGMASVTNWITYAGASGNPPSFSSVHHLTGCGNYYQALEPAVTTGFSSGGANINDPSGAVPRVWATPLASAATDAAYSAQMYTGYQGDIFQAHFSGVNPFFNITYQGTIRSSGGLALSTIVNNASTLTLTTANKNVIANAASGPQTLTLPSCYTPLPDKSAPTGLEFTIVKSDASSNAVTLQTVSSQNIDYNGASAQTLVIASPGKRTLICGPDYNWYAY